MKSFLHKAFLWGGMGALLSGAALAQPIQLIPKSAQLSEVIAPLPPLREDKNGFWEGTPPSVIDAYFSKIPTRLPSPALRLMRTEILNEPYPFPSENLVYAKARLSLLTQTGHLEKARELLLETSFPDKDALLLDLQWQGGEAEKACEKVSNLMRSSSDLNWKKQNIYCLYARGEEERGKIALELLSESNAEAFSLLAALFEGTSPAFDPAIAASPFLLTVWAQTRQDIPEKDLNALAPASLALIAKLEKIPEKTRLLAAEKAFAVGGLAQDDLSKLAQEASSETLLGRVKDALKTHKIEDLAAAFEAASHDHTLSFVLAAFIPDLMKIESSLETLPLAPFLIHGFLDNKQKDLAEKWATFYRREAPDEAIAVLPLLHLSLPSIPWTEAHLQAWQAYQRRTHPTDAAQNSYALRRLFEALGETPGAPLTGEPASPSWRQEKGLFEGAALDLLEAAVKSHRQGELLLLTLALLGETPLKDLPTDKVARLVEALTKGGRPDEARALAVDFLRAKGI